MMLPRCVALPRLPDRQALFGLLPSLLLGPLLWAIATTGHGGEREATPTRSIRTLPGFQVELLASAQEDEGSWISMTFDPQGRLIVGIDDQGLGRFTLAVDEQTARFERLQLSQPLRHPRGVLMVGDTLYVSATDSQALYILRDRDGDDQFEAVEELAAIPYHSRYGHGTNQMIVGPDNAVYLISGNDVQFPTPLDADSPYRDPQNDWLLPSPHDAGQDDRVGYVARLDPHTKSWSILAGGLRNPFDLAFNRDGELFTWDADMEWDVGLPWYRPTRLNHVVSGGEYGWRWGTGKWPAWYPDSLPAIVDTGYSSPTGMSFGYAATQWPERFREALYMADWQLGRILMVDLRPEGASYAAESHLFVEGAPLNVCDLAFGPDGHMYFITGGRGSQSGLYRVRYSGTDATLHATHAADDLPALPHLPDATRATREETAAASLARETRHALERLHRTQDKDQLDFIWLHLGSQDRWLRSAARVALENQPSEWWRERLQSAPDSPATHTALLALARVGRTEDQRLILSSLAAVPWEDVAQQKLNPAELLSPLRAFQLTIIRQGELSAIEQSTWRGQLEPLFPQPHFAFNWLLGELLVALRSSHAADGCLQLMEQSSTQEEQIQFAKLLTLAGIEWDEQRAIRLLRWLATTQRMSGGKLVRTTLDRLKSDLLGQLPQTIVERYQAEIEALEKLPPAEAWQAAQAQTIVQQWTMEDLIDEVLGMDINDRSAASGHQALAIASCLRCHRFGDLGSPVGPDLSQVGKRYDGRALLESILEPSRQIDPKYVVSAYLLDDGRVVTGRALSVSRDQLVIETDAMSGASTTILRADIEQSRQSPQSSMPSGLLDVLTREQVLDLIALLRRGAE